MKRTAIRRLHPLAPLAIGMALATPAAAQTLALEHVNVVSMEEGAAPLLEDHTVIVDGESIRWVGPAAEADVPADAQRVDGSGKTLIPGLIDTHLRLLSEQHVADPFAPIELGVVASYGVTTARLMDGRPRYLMLRDRVLADDLFSPMLFVGSPPLTARPVGRCSAGVVPEDSFEARELVRTYAAAGYDFVQLGFDLRPVVHAAVVQQAREENLPVVGRVAWKTGLEIGLDSGMQGEHLDQFFEWLMPEDTAYGPSGMGVWRARYWEPLKDVDESRIAELARMVAESGTFHSPALLYHESGFIGRRTSADVDPDADGRYLSPSVKESLFEPRAQFERARPDEAMIQRYAELRGRIVRELAKAGVPLLAGSNAPDWGHVGGLALHDELRCMVDVGLSPLDALATATRNPARWLGGEGLFGTIAAGRRADLVLLAKSPLEDIANTKTVEGVVLRGSWHARAELESTRTAAAEALSTADLRPAVLTQR